MNNYGSPTTADYAHATNYANAQINRMKCQDPDLLAKYCSKDFPKCFEWVQDEKKQIFDTPNNITTKPCQSDVDCKNSLKCIPNPNYPNISQNPLVCGFSPDNVAAGTCNITSPELCVTQSELPYTCDSTGYCQFKKKKDQKKPYLEWHPTETEQKGSGVCQMGNFLLKEWCQNPKVRCVKNKDGSYPANCTGGKDTRGVTDVPPFYYDDNKGRCYMTQGYCSWFGTDYKSRAASTKCQTNEDCGDGNICYFDTYSDERFCTGPKAECDLSTGKEIGEMVLGKTIFQLFNQARACKEFFTPIVENFKQMSIALADENCVQEKKVIGSNFAGEGVHLYMIIWKNEPSPGTTGFMAEEVRKKYPDLVQTKNGKKYVCVSLEQVKESKDKNIKRIFGIIQMKKMVLDSIMSSIMSSNASSNMNPNK